jgi:cell division protein FtsL
MTKIEKIILGLIVILALAAAGSIYHTMNLLSQYPNTVVDDNSSGIKVSK